MKRILFILLLTALSLSQANASDTNTAVNWTGTYNTNFGQIILHQKANYVVGTYRDLGGMRSVFVRDNELTGLFYNNGKEGYFKFTKTSKGFTGKWGWTNKLEGGSWDGTRVADVKQHYLKGKWDTNYDDLFLIHSPTGIVAGHYGDKGGMIWGKYASTKIFTGHYTNTQGREPRTCSFIFTDNNTFKGKFDTTEYGSWNGTRMMEKATTSAAPSTNTAPQPKFRLKITLNSFKCNGADNVFNREKGFVRFETGLKTLGASYKPKNIQLNEGVTEIIPNYEHFLYRSWPEVSRDFPVGVNQQVNNSLEYHIIYSLNRMKSGRNDFYIDFIFLEKFIPLIFIDTRGLYSRRQIDLTEVLKFLSEETRAEDYPIVSGADGRRRLPNSSDTFWLETIGGKRYIRGYGDVIEPKQGKIRFGYHYTMELRPL